MNKEAEEPTSNETKCELHQFFVFDRPKKSQLSFTLSMIQNVIPTAFYSISTYLSPKLLPSSFHSLDDYWKGKLTHPEWSLPYHITVNAARSNLEEVAKTQDVLACQRDTSSQYENLVPPFSHIKKKKFAVNTSVQQFLKRRAPGSWCESAQDSKYLITGEYLISGKQTQDFVLYLIHGGAYVMGSSAMYRSFSWTYSKKLGAPVFSIDYRLAPQHQYPCGLIDVVSGYLHLLETFKPSKIIFIGAGGGLALASLMVIRDMGRPIPAGAILLSPWVDLTHSCPSYFENTCDYLPNYRDNRFPTRLNYYSDNEYLTLPYVSPYFAEDLDRLPSFLVQCGSEERLYDEITEMCSKLKKVRLEVYSAHVHVFQAIRFCNASMKAIDRLLKFCIECVEQRQIINSRIDFDFNGDFVSLTSI